MRDSLRQSLVDSPSKDFERYPKGSAILCNACGLPIAFLERAIEVGEGAGRTASKMKPLSVSQVYELAGREDIDAGISARLRSMSVDDVRAHVAKLHEYRSGDPMICPACKCAFVQVLAVEYHEVLDKAYTIEMLTIPPAGHSKPAPVRGKKISATGDWVHEVKVH